MTEPLPRIQHYEDLGLGDCLFTGAYILRWQLVSGRNLFTIAIPA